MPWVGVKFNNREYLLVVFVKALASPSLVRIGVATGNVLHNTIHCTNNFIGTAQNNGPAVTGHFWPTFLVYDSVRLQFVMTCLL